VATPDGGQALVQHGLEAFGRVDIVVNNAGILRDRAFHNLSDQQIDDVFKVHLYGAFNVTKAAWAAMRERGYGRVLNTTSISGWLGNFGQSNYGAAKAGLIGLTKVLAIEGAKYGIHVNAISPSATTRMSVDPTRPVNSLLDPELVAPVACWLVHEDCQATGEVYTAIGGLVSRLFFARTRGHFDPHLTVEGVRDHFDEINDEADCTIPQTIRDELTDLEQRVRSWS
jgi:NAD(P)-dependent dehydrogenase (short-subunit alcohol dehydrogenase family)